MKRTSLDAIVPERDFTTLLARAILTGSAVVGGIALWIFLVKQESFSGIFLMLLRRDILCLPVFIVAIICAKELTSRAQQLAPNIERLGTHPFLTSIIVLCILVVLAPLIYQYHPLSMDEYAAHFQSQVFAAGKLTGHFPSAWLPFLIPPDFFSPFLAGSPITGSVISLYWPGFALLMAPFSWGDLAWLCNPVLTVISIFSLMVTMHKLLPSSPEASGWAAVLTLSSPVFLATGVSFYAMTALMLANLIYTWGFIAPNPKTLFYSGIIGSIALTLHNPLPHLLFSLPWILWLIRKHGWGRDLLALLIGYLPLTLLLGVGWILLRGHITESIQPAHTQDAFEILLGIATKVFVLPDMNILYFRIAGFTKLWLWAMPGLIMLAILGWWHGRKNIYISLLAQSALFTFFGYFIIPFDQGHGWGYRYFHSTWFALPILAAYYLNTDQFKQAKTSKSFIAALTVTSLLLITPVYLLNERQFISQSMTQIPQSDPVNSILLTFVYPDKGIYAADLIQNDPFLRNKKLYFLGSDPKSDAKIALTLSPKAKEVACTRTGTMWRLPSHQHGTDYLLRNTSYSSLPSTHN